MTLGKSLHFTSIYLHVSICEIRHLNNAHEAPWPHYFRFWYFAENFYLWVFCVSAECLHFPQHADPCSKILFSQNRTFPSKKFCLENFQPTSLAPPWCLCPVPITVNRNYACLSREILAPPLKMIMKWIQLLKSPTQYCHSLGQPWIIRLVINGTLWSIFIA